MKHSGNQVPLGSDTHLLLIVRCLEGGPMDMTVVGVRLVVLQGGVLISPTAMLAKHPSKEKEPKEATSQESRKRNLEEADFGYEKEDELGDTATSPTKPTVTGRVEEGKEKPDAQKKLAMGDVLAEKQTPSMVPPPLPKYISPREQKRSKREGKGKQVQEDEAGSLEECRRAQ